MNKKLILIIFCLFIVFFSAISFSSASDLTDNETVSASEDEAVEMPEQQEILADSSGSFDELDELVRNSSATLELNNSYTYSSGNTEPITIDKDITIEGKNHVLNGSNQASIFAIEGQHNVTLQNIVFANAFGDRGSAIFVGHGSKVAIVNCTFIANNATVDGGAIYINSTDAILKNSKFTGNYAINDGAALFVAGDGCKLYNSTFTRNIAGDDGPAINWQGSNGLMYNVTCTDNRGISRNKTGNETSSTRGGAICLTGGNVTVSKSVFRSNSAWMDENKDFSKVDGGALFITGNGVTVIDTQFEGCNATNNGGALYVIGNNTEIIGCDFKNCIAGDGAALFVDGDDCKLCNSTFASNIAGGDGAIFWEGDRGVIYNITCRNNKGLDGGALYVEGDGCKLCNSTFTGNVADDDGGAIFWEGSDGVIYNITCNDNKGISKTKPDGENTSSTRGGTLSIIGNNVVLSKSSFIKSSAYMDEGKDTSKVDGGAVFITGNDVIINETQFYDCTATNNGGAIYIIGNNTQILNCSIDKTQAYIGGAIFIDGQDTIVDNSLFRHNLASDKGGNGGSGGAIYVQGDGGTISNSDFAYDDTINYGGAISVWGANANITGNVFADCTAKSYNGGSIYINGANATVSLSNFTRSTAKNQFAQGGAIQVSGDNADILDCNFEDCFAYYGGVIYISGANALIDGSDFRDSVQYKPTPSTRNQYPQQGGAIYVSGEDAAILRSNFTNLNSEESGGAIYIYGPNTLINSSNFNNCKGTDGGAIYVFGNNAEIHGSTFNSSSATNGGAVYLTAWGALIKDSNVTDCTATTDGGAIYVAGGGTNIVGSNFESCIAKGNSPSFVDGGGAIYVDGPDTHISTSNFNNNEATATNARGGTIYIKGERTRIDGSNFNKSHASREGGIIYIMGEEAVIDSSTFNNSYSSFKGGAIAVTGHNATIERSVFENIYANNHGGAIFVDGEETYILYSSFNNCTVKGTNSGGAIYIDDIKTTIAYSNFTLCHADSAGAIYVNGIGTSLFYCNLDNNTACSAGAIKVFGNDTILSHCNLTYNRATSGAGGALDIGGANASVYSCWFDNNDANTTGGAINWKGGHGDDTILGSTFTNNGCHDIKAGGGAIFWTAGDPDNIPPGGLILNSIFINNTSYRHHGGAIDWFYARDSTINNCLFVNNTAYGDGGALYTGDQNGHGHHLMMSNNQFYNNTAKKHGGAIANQMSDSWIYNNTFDGNKAKASGGTILMKETHADNSVIDHCYIYNSFVDQTYYNMPLDNAYGVGGGAIRIGHDSQVGDGNITISNCAIINSTANKTWGGAILIDSGSRGSSLINVTIQNAMVLDGYGGAICWKGNGGTMNNVTIFNSSSNLANDDKAYGNGEKSANGGAIYLSATNCNFNDIKISKSSTTSNNDSCTKNDYGGAIYVSGASNTLTNIKIDDASALSTRMNANGGAIYWAGSSGTLINATISNTLANGQGGAIYWKGGSPNIENISIEYSQTNVTNSTNGANGGAIYLEPITNLNNVYIINSLASRDKGDVYGGAIYYKNTNKVASTMNNVTVIGSRASTEDGDSYGGAVYWDVPAAHYIYNSSFAENTADKGGALYSYGTTNIYDTSFTGNVALDGGALYATGGDDTLTNASFSHNSAKRGGAIFINNRHINMYDSHLEFNTAEEKGGAIYYNNVDLKTGNSEITNTKMTNNTAFQGSAIYANKFKNFSLKDVILLDNQANSKEFIEKTVGVDADGNNYTSAVFVGFDNILNAIWEDANGNLYCDNVTYLGAVGVTSFTGTPVKSDREVRINVTVETFNGRGQRINVTNLTTDANGRIYHIFEAEDGETYYFAYSHPSDRYYTYLRDTLSNRSLVNIYVYDPIYYGQNQTVLIYLTDGAWGNLNGTVTVTFNDTNHTTWTLDVVNGSYRVENISTFAIGHYNATAKFDGDLNHTGDTDWTLFTVLPCDDLKITKDVNVTGNLVNVTDTIKYTINVTNLGPSDAMGVNVTEILSPYLKLLKNETNGYGYYNYTGGYWYIGDLAVGDNATLTIEAQVIHIGPITNTVWVEGEGRDINLTNNIASARNLTAMAFIDLQINKTDNITTNVVNVTDKIKFVITVVNKGPYNATGVYVSEPLDSHLDLISCNATKGEYKDKYTWDIGNLTVGETHNLTIIAKVISPGIVSNVVVVYGAENDTNLTNNRAQIDNITALSIVDLAIAKEVNVTTGFVNITDKIKFVVTVHNHGPCDATNVTVTEKLSDLLRVVDGGITVTGGNYNQTTGLWTIEKLANQSTATLTIIAKVIGLGTIANVVSVSSNENDTNKSNNNDSIKNITVLPVVDLTIDKEVNVTTGVVNVSDMIKFTITVHNNGPCDAHDVNVAERLNEHLRFNSSDTRYGQYDVANGVWRIGNLTNQSTAVLTIVAKVISNGTIGNVVVVSSRENDTNKSNNRDNITNITALPIVDLRIVKEVNVTGTEVEVMDRIKFTITVYNDGPSNATGVYVEEPLSPLLRIISNQTSGRYDGYTWYIGDMANGTNTTLIIEAQVIYSGIIENAVIVYSPNVNDTNLTNNKDNITPLNATAHVDLGIFKGDNVSSNNRVVYIGDLIVFTVIAYNNGPCNATGVVVAEPLDSHLELISYNVTSSVYPNRNDTEYINKYTWNIGNLDVGELLTLKILARVAVLGNITNAVHITGYDNDSNPDNNNASIPNITALAVVDVQITKEVNVTSGFVYLGDKIKFTVTVRNNGPCDATGVYVEEHLSNLLGRDYYYNTTDGSKYDGFTWNIGNLTNNSSVVLTIIANVTGVGNISNAVVAHVNENDTNMSNNNDSIDNITARPLVDLYVNKTVDVSVVNVTDYVTYTINVVNFGPSTATDVNITEHLSPLVRLIEAKTVIGTYDNSTNVWNIPMLEAKIPVCLELTVQVISNGTIENVITATCNETDKNASNNNYTSDNVTALPIVDVKVNKTVNVTAVNDGDYVKYTISVKNDGPSNATEVKVTDRLDSRLRFVSFDASRSGISYDNSTETFNIGNLAVNESVVINMIVKVIGIGEIPNHVNVTSKENDTNASNNENSSDNLTVRPIVDVSITKRVNVTLVNVTDLIEYTITVKNAGPSKATEVNVTDKLDSHLKFDSFDSSRRGITYDNATGIALIGDLDANETVVLTIVARVIAIGNIENVANVTSKENDTNKSNNNGSSDNVTALPIVDVKVNKTVNATVVNINEFVKYTISVKNDGPSNATEVVVTDKFDSRLTFISFESSRSGITYDNVTGEFGIGNLNVNETVVINVIVKVSGIGEIPNYVHVTSRENDTNASNNHNSSDNVTGLPLVDVKINKTVSVSEAKLGDEFTYIITVHNNGPCDAVNVNVTEKLSDYVTLVSFDASKGVYDNTKNSWYVGNLTNGETSTLTLTVKVIGVGVIENVVSVKSDGNDTNLTNNNYACDNVTVLNLDTPIDLDCYDIDYGDDEIITVKLPVNATGAVNITVGNRTYDNVPIDHGSVVLPVYDLGGGDYTVNVTYGGDGIYNPNSTSGKFTVRPVTPVITIEVEDIWVGEVEVLNVTVNAPGTVFVTVWGRTVEISLDNGEVTTDVLAVAKDSYLGNATWNIIGLPVGPYPAFALYPGNENYTSVNTTDLFHVRDKPSTVVVTADDIYVGEDAIINIKVGPEGVSGDVIVTVEGDQYIIPIDENGEAQLIVSDLKAGLKHVTVEYEGNIVYRPSENSTTFNVLKLRPPVDVFPPDITVGEDGVITVTVPEDATGEITIEVEGKRYTAPIVDGKAIFRIPSLKVGVHDIKVFYSGDDKYLPANTTGSIKVNPKDEPPIDENETVAPHEKVGLEVHETGNPIVLAILVLLSVGLTQIRRFRK